MSIGPVTSIASECLPTTGPLTCDTCWTHQPSPDQYPGRTVSAPPYCAVWQGAARWGRLLAEGVVGFLAGLPEIGLGRSKLSPGPR